MGERTRAGFSRRLASEFLGTTMLLAVVIGSGIMGERLAAGNTAIALLGNTIATGSALVVLITIFGPISGAHFNPAVTLAFCWRKEIGIQATLGYMLAQIIGAIAGVYVAHLMFAEPLFQISTKMRDGAAQGFAEFVATFGLLGTIFGCSRFRSDFTPMAVGLYIAAAYWFTASTSFANPAVTIARAMSNSFAGIAPASAPLFILGQLIAVIIAVPCFGWLFQLDRAVPGPRAEAVGDGIRPLQG